MPYNPNPLQPENDPRGRVNTKQAFASFTPPPIQSAQQPSTPQSWPLAKTGPTTSPFANFLGTAANFPNLLKLMNENAPDSYGAYGPAGTIRQILQLNEMGAPAIPYASLFEILGQQGQTSPERLNLQLSDASRSASNQQDAIQGLFARNNMAQSGLNQAVQTAAGNAGSEQRAQILANEQAQAEQRKRQDLQLFMDMFVGPAFASAGLPDPTPGSSNVQNVAAILSAFGGGFNALSGWGGKKKKDDDDD